jgi:hypothetical protein
VTASRSVALRTTSHIATKITANHQRNDANSSAIQSDPATPLIDARPKSSAEITP